MNMNFTNLDTSAATWMETCALLHGGGILMIQVALESRKIVAQFYFGVSARDNILK